MTAIQTTITGDSASRLRAAGASAPAATSASGAATADARGTGNPAVIVDVSASLSGSPASLDVPKTFEEMVDQRTTAFAQQLSDAFQAANIRVDGKVSLHVDRFGTITADGPRKEKIEKLFRDDPKLAKAFKDVASLNGLKAAKEALRLYVEEKKAAHGDDEKKALAYARYTGRSFLIQELAGHFTFEDGKLTSAAVEYADALAPPGDKRKSDDKVKSDDPAGITALLA